MKILTILGARPQFIKAGSVSREIAKHDDVHEIIVHTGQHYDSNMSDIFFDEMQIPKPDYFLGIGGKSHGAMTGQMMEKIEEVALQEKPDWIMVYGDTNSTLAGALVASKLHIRLAHIEAGLRSFNMQMPEEVNRILTDRVSNVLFCPTDTAVENLKEEGFEHFDARIIKSGDVMYDGALFYRTLAKKPQILLEDAYLLCTIHRAENTDDPQRIESIFSALNQIAKEKQVVLPLHPRTKKMIQKCNIKTDNIMIIEPVGYLEMVWLIDHCSLVMTDSDGLQKEAYFFAKPCITLRDETEWVELVDCGVNQLAGAQKEKILASYRHYQRHKPVFDDVAGLYGKGDACRTIVQSLKEESSL